MKTRLALLLAMMAGTGTACRPAPEQTAAQPGGAPAGLAAVQDDVSQNTVVQIAAGSPDHKTLVTAVTTAGLVDVLASSGPYTVFAPTDAAFDNLPKGTVDDLLKPANLSRLQMVLRHHVTTSVYELADLSDGLVLGMADGKSVTVSRRNGDVHVGEAKILGSARGSNGIVHVIDAVIVP